MFLPNKSQYPEHYDTKPTKAVQLINDEEVTGFWMFHFEHYYIIYLHGAWISDFGTWEHWIAEINFNSNSGHGFSYKNLLISSGNHQLIILRREKKTKKHLPLSTSYFYKIFYFY